MIMKKFERSDFRFTFKAPLNYVEETLNAYADERGIVTGHYDALGKARDIFFAIYDDAMAERFSHYPELGFKWLCDLIDIKALMLRFESNFAEGVEDAWTK